MFRRQDISLEIMKIFKSWLFKIKFVAVTQVTVNVFGLIPTCRSWKIPPVRTSLAGITSTGTKSPFSFISRI